MLSLVWQLNIGGRGYFAHFEALGLSDCPFMAINPNSPLKDWGDVLPFCYIFEGWIHHVFFCGGKLEVERFILGCTLALGLILMFELLGLGF